MGESFSKGIWLDMDRSLVLEGFRWFPLVKNIHMNPLKLGPRSFWDLGTIFAALLILARFGLGRTGLTGRVYRSDR